MRFVIQSLTRCPGTNHIEMQVSVDGGNAIAVAITKDEINLGSDELRIACLARVRSAVKEAGATTPAQIQTALVGKEFQV